MIGYASIQTKDADSTFILKTTDGGLTWQKKLVTTRPVKQLQGIGFFNDTLGWTGGRTDVNDKGFYETRDGGETWKYYPFGHNYDRFFKVNDSILYASGAKVYKFNIHQQSSPTGISNANHHSKINNLITVYPNPVKTKITVMYKIGEVKTNVELCIYDSKGKLIRQLLGKSQTKGEYESEFRIENIPAGHYFLSYKTDNYYEAEKIVIVQK